MNKKFTIKEFKKIAVLKEFFNKNRLYIIIFVILLIAVFSYLTISNVGSKNNKWQAVFLENNQVYFGKLDITKDFYILTKVYYLQSESERKENKIANPASPSIDEEKITKLIKLGNELHGPEDQMFIEKSKVLFWENMKDSSNIVKSIEAFEKE